MKKLMRWGALFILSTTVYAECESMVRIHWSVDVATKKITKLNQAKDTETICTPPVQDSRANLLLTLQAGKKVFQRRLFVARETISETLDKDQELRASPTVNKVLFIDSHVPLWAKDATLKITSLPNHELVGGRP